MELFITMMVVLTVFAAAADEYNAVNVKENEGHVYVFSNNNYYLLLLIIYSMNINNSTKIRLILYILLSFLESFKNKCRDWFS